MITAGSPPGKEQVKHLLLVEDEVLIAMDEAALLEKQGYRVTTVHSGAEAVEGAAQQDIDLILMDIDLGSGKMDGAEAAEIILQDRDIPVVFLSSHTEPEVVERTEKITSYGYVVKSSGSTVLLNAVKMALRLRDAGKEKAERELRVSMEKFKALYDNAPIPYQSLDESGAFIDVNPAWLKVLGYSRDEVIGKNFSEVLHSDWVSHFKKNFPEFKRLGSVCNVEFRMRRKDGSCLDVSFEGRIGYNPDGSFRQTYCVFQDITAQKQARVSLQQTRHWYDTLVQSSMDGFWRVGADGRLLEVNDTYCRMSGYSREELIGMPASRLEAAENPEEVARHIQKVIEKGSDRFESLHRRKDGTLFNVEVVSTYVPSEPVQLLSFIRDITEAKKAREELEESEAKFRNLVEAAPVSILMMKQGRYTYGNQSAAELLGYEKPEEINGLDVLMTIAPEYHDRIRERIRTIEAGSENPTIEMELIRRDGSRCWTNSTSVAIRQDNEPAAVIIGQDITDRKVMENVLKESEANLTALIENTDDIIVLRNTRGGAILWNRAFSDICKELFNTEAYYGIRTMDLLPPEQAIVWERLIEKVLRGETIRQEFSHTFKDGSVRHYDLTFNPVIKDNVIIGFSEFNRDITALKTVERQLRRTLEEKEILLQEMNHRIKNNLVMVESLIRLKQKEAGTTVDLSDIEHRIDTIRILHEKLYKTGDVSWIDLKDYLGNIADSVFSTLSKDRIECINEMDQCRIKTKSAVALGLITNELASNTIKHAHTEDNRSIRFVMSLDTKTGAETCVLTVTNDGPPFPEDIHPATPKTLGMRLVTLLVEQIGGRLSITRSPHPVFEISFPRDRLINEVGRHG